MAIYTRQIAAKNLSLCTLMLLGLLPSLILRADIHLQDFNELPVSTGITDATAMAFAPDGRLFVCEKEGTLRIIKNDSLLRDPVLTLSVAQLGERGLIGVAIDPGFPDQPYVYLHYSVPSYPIHNRVSRFTLTGDTAVPGSEQVLLDLTPLGNGVGHNGGALHFGMDGKLYIGVGDNEVPTNSQSLSNHQGKLLRINPDGSIPVDNPFVSQVSGSLQAIWAIGLRNPFTFAVQPGTGRMFINDVGNHDWEEIDEAVAGANYGWPFTEGPTSDPRFQSPVFAYPHIGTQLTGAAIVGGAFYNPPKSQYPPEYTGSYFFADYVAGWIMRLDPATGVVSHFADNLAAAVDLQVGPDGNLYYLSRGADHIVLDNDVAYLTATAPGTVYKYLYTPNQIPVYTQQPIDRTVAVGQSATFRIAGYGSTPLSFAWQKDGVAIPGADTYTDTIASATKADDGAQFRAVMRNPIGTTLSAPATLHIIDATPPVGTILSPDPTYMYRAGDTVNFAGEAFDAQDGPLPASAFSWQVVFHHDAHTHPFINSINNVTQGSFTIPTTGETSANVWYEILLTVADSKGLAQTTIRDIHPQTSMLRMETVPYGLGLSLEDQPRNSAFSVQSVVGLQRTLGAISPQDLDGVSYEFVSWSDGGTLVHDVLTPPNDTTYRAIFRSVVSNPAGPVSDYFRSAGLNTSLWNFVNPLGDGGVQANGSGLALTLPAGVSHDAWVNGNNTARILQAVPDTDFTIEAKFDSAVVAPYQDQGILIEQDTANYLRMLTYYDGAQLQACVMSFNQGVASILFSQGVPDAKPPYIVRVKRVGNNWTINWFITGVSTPVSFNVAQPLSVNRMGVYAGNNGPGTAPAFTSMVDYFVNTLNPQ